MSRILINSLHFRASQAWLMPIVLNLISFLFSRAGAYFMFKCSLERLLLVGEGQGQAGKRRQWARREEEKARWDREAQWLVRVTGRPLSRRGDFPSL